MVNHNAYSAWTALAEDGRLGIRSVPLSGLRHVEETIIMDG